MACSAINRRTASAFSASDNGSEAISISPAENESALLGTSSEVFNSDASATTNGGMGLDIINGVTTGLSKDTISDSTKVIDTSFSYDFDELLAGLV